MSVAVQSFTSTILPGRIAQLTPICGFWSRASMGICSDWSTSPARPPLRRPASLLQRLKCEQCYRRNAKPTG